MKNKTCSKSSVLTEVDALNSTGKRKMEKTSSSSLSSSSSLQKTKQYTLKHGFSNDGTDTNQQHLPSMKKRRLNNFDYSMLNKDLGWMVDHLIRLDINADV